MKRLGLAYAMLMIGCANKPCETTSQCGSGEVCAAATCQALSCSSTYFAVDPSNGNCRPLPACGNRDDVRGWASCDDPCRSQGENSCIADVRCQPSYDTESDNSCAKSGSNVPVDEFGGNPCGGSRNFVGCRANPMRVDPCAGLGEDACNADSRCTGSDIGGSGSGCACPPGGVCNCPFEGDNSVTWECRLKTCGDYASDGECKQHSECSDNPNAQPVFNGVAEGVPIDAGVQPTGAADQPFFGCFEKGFGSCLGMDQSTCLQHSECHPVGGPGYCAPGASCASSGGKYFFCEPDDGLQRCNGDSDCGGDQRCNNTEQCAPPVSGTGGVGFVSGGTPIPDGLTTSDAPLAPACPGLCVPKGCTGDGEARCVGDPSCEPIYILSCSPYGGGGEDFAAPSCSGGGGALPANTDGSLIAGSCGGPCEPSFTQCTDRTIGSVVDPEKSVLVRDPQVIDAPMFAFVNVMAALAGNQDPAVFVTSWLNQIGQDVTVEGKTAALRPLATSYMATWPHRADGQLDIGKLGFQVTSLSNRIDLAGSHDCGEARITYALNSGVTDRRHRMTVIVELKQPDDGAGCSIIANQWIALSRAQSDTLLFGVASIYQPLLAPAHLGQVRTNEFLVGEQDPTLPLTPWELREWHLGADGGLHLALSKQALDPNAVGTADFANWMAANVNGIDAQQVTIPEAFLAVTSSEDGSRISLQSLAQTQDLTVPETALNSMACAGCHTTETNSAFAHVGERFNGSGRAKISDFLLKQLPIRGNLLFKIGQGRLTPASRAIAKPVH